MICECSTNSGIKKIGSDLSHEHGSRRDFHVVTKLEVLQKCDGLCHTYVAIHLEAHIGNWVTWVYIPNYILSDDV